MMLPIVPAATPTVVASGAPMFSKIGPNAEAFNLDGNFYILNDDLSNTGEDRNILKRIITLNDTQDNYSKLYKLISSNKLYTTHI